MQVVGYETGVGRDGAPGTPALVLAAEGAVRRESLSPGTELAFTLGERHCAGVRDGDSHVACGASEAPYCPAHSSTWPCARCTGNCEKPLESCEQEHAVYLAAFAPDAFKVGVTRSWRLNARLREQGADRGAHVHTVSDGRVARRIEADVAADVPDRVRVATKVGGLHREVDAEAWAALLEGFRVVEEFAFDYGLDLDSRPVPATVAAGTVRGVKGRVLVLERAGTAYAVDLRDLVGYDLRAGGDDRELQASLAAFD